MAELHALRAAQRKEREAQAALYKGKIKTAPTSAAPEEAQENGTPSAGDKGAKSGEERSAPAAASTKDAGCKASSATASASRAGGAKTPRAAAVGKRAAADAPAEPAGGILGLGAALLGFFTWLLSLLGLLRRPVAVVAKRD